MKVVVVGAGPSGLAIALGLKDRGVEVVVVEGGPIGGRTRTIEQDGYRIELGPAGILDDAPDTTALVEKLGLRPIHASPLVKRRYLVRDGKPRALPSGPLSLIFGGALTFAEKRALLRERSIPAETIANETVAHFARRRFGDSLAKKVVQPMVVGVFAGDYEELELESAFPRLAALERQHGSVVRGTFASKAPRGRLITFPGGMGALPAAMAKRFGDVTRGTVTSIDRGRVHLGSESIACDHVVLTGEPSLFPIDLEYAQVASVSLGWRRSDVRHPLDGFGLLVPRTEAFETIGVLFMTSIFPDAGLAPDGDVLLRVMMGGPNAPDIDALDDATILETARREVSGFLGIDAAPRLSHLQRWPRAIPQYTVGHATRRAAWQAQAKALGVTIAGTSLNGVGVNDVLRDAARIVGELA